jgi:hypothetical protein
MKHSIIILFLFTFLFACGESKKDESSSDTKSDSKPETTTPKKDPSEYDPNRGQGKWTAENIGLEPTLDATMASGGEKIFGVKCSSCHKLTDERLVGPGWAGVTTRRTPEWIMNFITNPDPMITKDPVLQAQLELCLVRMPNQNLNEIEARSLLEFMRKNDGVN